MANRLFGRQRKLGYGPCRGHLTRYHGRCVGVARRALLIAHFGKASLTPHVIAMATNAVLFMHLCRDKNCIVVKMAADLMAFRCCASLSNGHHDLGFSAPSPGIARQRRLQATAMATVTLGFKGGVNLRERASTCLSPRPTGQQARRPVFLDSAFDGRTCEVSQDDQNRIDPGSRKRCQGQESTQALELIRLFVVIQADSLGSRFSRLLAKHDHVTSNGMR